MSADKVHPSLVKTVYRQTAIMFSCYNASLTCRTTRTRFFFFFLVRALVVHNLLCLTPHSASLRTLQPRLLRWRLRAHSQPLCILSTLQPSQANDEGAAPTLSYEELSIWHLSARVCTWEGLGGSHSRFGRADSFYSGSRMGYNVGIKQKFKYFRLYFLPIKTY